jgi:hypothetical protein
MPKIWLFYIALPAWLKIDALIVIVNYNWQYLQNWSFFSNRLSKP